jgi:hypothetical protein
MVSNSKTMKGPSQESTLSFSKQSRIKKQSNINKDFKGLNLINSEIYHPLIKNSESYERRSFQRAASLTEIKGNAIQNDLNNFFPSD